PLVHLMRLVDRFRRLDGGYATGPYHYVLDQLGAMVIAAERDRDLDKVRWRRDKAFAISDSQRLAHHLGVNGFFCALLRHARHTSGARLWHWWSERRITDWVFKVVHPDGWGLWEEAGRSVGFFLEYDRGSEPLDRLVAKLDGYAS